MMIENSHTKNGLPEGWIESKLRDVCDVLDSQRSPINSEERQKRIAGKSESELFPYFGATGQVGYIDDFLLDGEFILLGEDGAPFLEPFRNKAYLVKGKIWVNNHAHILRAFASNKFLCHYLNQVNYRDFVTGTTRLKLNQSRMNEIPVLMPSPTEQHRIVDKIEALFSELDKGVEQLKTAAQQLKVYRQSVLKWAFEGKLTNGNMQWMRPTLGKVISISSGDGLTKTKRNEEGEYLVYGGNGVTGRHSQYMFEDSKLIIGRVGVHCGNAHITSPRSWVTDNAFVVSFDENAYDMSFLLHLVKHLRLNRYSSSTAQPVISQGKIYPIEVSIPARKEDQHKIVQEIESRLSVCDKLEETITASLEQSEALRQSILKGAFEGRLVEQDANDPPASELLEKVKTDRQKSDTRSERRKARPTPAGR